MKEKDEFFYLCYLYNSSYVKKWLSNPNGGTLSDFERVCKIGSNNYPFRQWLKKLIKEGVLEHKGKDSGKNDIYFVNESLCLNKIRDLNLYKDPVKKPTSAIYEGFLRH